MKEIQANGRTYEQKVKPLDCIFCPYETGCNSWGCVSPGCEITRECFGHKSIGTHCPFENK